MGPSVMLAEAIGLEEEEMAEMIRIRKVIAYLKECNERRKRLQSKRTEFILNLSRIINIRHRALRGVHPPMPMTMAM